MTKHEMSLTMSDPKSGWCNGCAAKPPYTPNVTYALRNKSVVITYCPSCAKVVRDMFTNLIAENENAIVTKLKPLRVSYVPGRVSVGEYPADELHLQSLQGVDLHVLTDAIERGVFNHIVLRPAAAIGWRIFVDREVHFQYDPYANPDDQLAQRQAAVRILEKKRG